MLRVTALPGEGTARCICCFREELRRGAEVLSVPMPGGTRRPAVPGPLAAWRALQKVQRGGLPFPVAVCAACGQPMVCKEGELPLLDSWVIELPEGPIVVEPDGRVRGVDQGEADRRIEDHFRAATEEKNSAATVGFTLVLLGSVMALGGLIGACECPNMLLALIGAGVAARHRDR